MHINETRKITTISILISLIGALLLLDRSIGFIFSDFCPVMIVAVIDAYHRKYGNNGIGILSFGLLLIGYLFGNIVSYVYFPIGVCVGLISSHTKKTLKTMVVSYFVGEILVSFVIYPLLSIGFSPFTGNLNFFQFYLILSFILSALFLAFIQGLLSYIISLRLEKMIKK